MQDAHAGEPQIEIEDLYMESLAFTGHGQLL